MFDQTMFARFEGELRRVAFVAKKLDCSEDHLVRLADDGEIEFVDISGKGAKRRDIRFTDAQIDDFAVSRTRRAAGYAPPRKVCTPKTSIEVPKEGSFADSFRAKQGA